MSASANTIKKILELLRLRGSTVTIDEAGRRISLLTEEDEWFKQRTPELIKELKYLSAIIARQAGEEPFSIDIDNYGKERERLIVELAKAAAQKAVATKQEVKLPAMNAFERRLIHTELSIRPDVKTESAGEGKERSVVIKPI